MGKIQHCLVPEEVVKPTLTLIEFNRDEIITQHIDTLLNFKFRADRTRKVSWLNVDGIGDKEAIVEICKTFELDGLTAEDITHTDSRPKMDIHNGAIHLVLQMLNYKPVEDRFENEQLFLVLGKNYLITFQEEKGDMFDRVRRSLQNNSQFRSHGAAYLAYAILDAVVDVYEEMPEKMDFWIDDLENKLVDQNIQSQDLKDVPSTITELRKDLSFLRRNIAPMRDITQRLRLNEDGIFPPENDRYFSDIHDHVLQVLDDLEVRREGLTILMDTYSHVVSLRMGNVMKTLTVITSIFIPLTFVTSIYGMNFTNMPEITVSWAYYAVLAVLAIISTTMVVWFYKKGWFK